MTKVVFDEDMKKLYGYTYNDVQNYYETLLVCFRDDDIAYQYGKFLIRGTMAMLEESFRLVNEKAKGSCDKSMSEIPLEDLYRLLDKLVSENFPQFKEWVRFKEMTKHD